MKYLVEYVKAGKWVPVLCTDIEDVDTFKMVANVTEYQYRILYEGKDITERYQQK